MLVDDEVARATRATSLRLHFEAMEAYLTPGPRDDYARRHDEINHLYPIKERPEEDQSAWFENCARAADVMNAWIHGDPTWRAASSVSLSTVRAATYLRHFGWRTQSEVRVSSAVGSIWRPVLCASTPAQRRTTKAVSCTSPMS